MLMSFKEKAPLSLEAGGVTASCLIINWDEISCWGTNDDGHFLAMLLFLAPESPQVFIGVVCKNIMPSLPFHLIFSCWNYPDHNTGHPLL